jgi:diacylglycerol kinase family enzyme
MKTFDQHFSEEAIIRQICKVRVKLAKSKSKKHLLHLLTSNKKYNYHTQSKASPTNEFENNQLELTQFLSTILPPRKKWLNLGEASRLNHKAIDAIKKAKERNQKLIRGITH